LLFLHPYYLENSELMFGIDHLCVNTYFRSFMDEEGYIPIAFVANYEHIACYGAPLDELMIKLSQKEDAILDVDMENETIRLKEGWETVRASSPMLLLLLLLLFAITAVLHSFHY
jgi:hypothetical protein